METTLKILKTMVTGDIPYVAVALFLAGVIGFLFIDRVLTRGVDLHNALFRDDNPVAGLEFGGVLMALLYMGYAAIVGPSASSFMADIGLAALCILLCLATFGIARGVLNAYVRSHNPKNEDLNHEIFVQRNWAAALMSLSLIIGIVNGLTEEDFLGSTPWRDAVLAITVLILAIGSVVVLYRFTHHRSRAYGLMSTLFTQDNAAAGVSLFGFALSVNIILFQATKMVKADNLPLLTSVGMVIGFSTLLVVLLLVARWTLEKVLKAMYKTDIAEEIFDQQNVGAGFIDFGVMIGTTAILVGGLV